MLVSPTWLLDHPGQGTMVFSPSGPNSDYLLDGWMEGWMDEMPTCIYLISKILPVIKFSLSDNKLEATAGHQVSLVVN